MIDPKIAELFNALKKDKDLGEQVFMGDDMSMDSVAPYGIPSGIPLLDLYLGGKGGLPAGKIIEYYGFERCGKTTAALQAAAEWQKRDGQVFFIDTEKSFDPNRARQLGVDPSLVVVQAADTVEQLFAHIYKNLETLKKINFTNPVLMIVDSVNGVPTESDVKGDISNNDRVGFEAKQIKRGVRKLNPILSDYEFYPSVIFITHAYAKISAYGGTDSGGGHGIKFYAAVRALFTHIGNLRDGDERKGQKIKIQLSKLKGGGLFQDKLDVILDNVKGFDKFESLKDAMHATEFAYRPKSSQTLTLFYKQENQVEIRNVDFEKWCEEQGGYDAVYQIFRKWAIKNGFITPWGKGE